MMDRCTDIKLQLKKWEASFFGEHQRKPSKADVAEAPEEIRKLYREYKAIKESKEQNRHSESEAVGQPQTSKPSMIEQAPELGCWGPHLNRGQMVPKPTLRDQVSAKASAQYFGMKLKSNLGAAVKEYPMSLRKSLTPKRKCTVQKEVHQATNSTLSEPPEALALKASPAQPPGPGPGPGLHPEELTALQPPSFPGLTPSKLPSCALRPRSAPLLGKFQQLKQTVTKQLSNLDPGWLDRCQGAIQMKDGQKGGHCSAGNGADPSIQGSPGRGSPGKQSLCLNTEEDRQEASCDSSREFYQGSTLKRSPLIPSAGDDCKPRAHPNQAVSTGLSEAKGDFSAVQDNHKLEIFSKNDSQQTKMPLGKETSRRPRDAFCEVKNGQEHPLKKGKNSSQKQLQDADPPEDGSRVNSKSGIPKAPGIKRKRAKESDGHGPVKKPRGTRPASGLKECEIDSKDAAGVPEEKGTIAPVPFENLLGEVDGEGCLKPRRSSSAVCRVPPKTGNFVRLNLKKKSHVKGYALKGRQLRKQVWKQKWQKKGEQFGGGGRVLDRGSDTCFRCGGLGHWASQCKERVTGQPSVNDAQLKESSCEEDVPLLSLEEVAQMTNTVYSKITGESQKSDGALEESHQEEEVTLYGQRPVYEPAPPPAPTEPLYKLGQDGKVKETPPEVFGALADLGYSSFRPGQEAAVMRILSGLSTLVVLSTGMGKSLCYQLPAYLYRKRSRCITLVISPLVSLMDDQVSGLPRCLKAVCLHSNMSKAQREAAVEKVKSGKVQVLLLSPEALVGGGLSGSSCLPPADQLPPVAFACIDEAHCVSEWSHNFRPCYLRLCKVLRDRLGVRCFLGLTATATLSTAKDVAHHLGVSESDGIAVRSAGVPPNLHLSVSADRDKDQALVNLLQGERFGNLDSVIVYCTRREEASRIAALIRTCLQGVKLRDLPAAEEKDDDGNLAGKKKKGKAKKDIRRPLKWISEAYHAGMSAAERRRVQNSFMSGELRVVVATVAFGMGLDKSDVRGVVHYNMPKTFESYVQEIGRAGRDGKPAHCHLFLHPEGEDLHELRRHIYADTVDFFTVKRLLQKVFPRCKCRELHRKQQELSRSSEVDDAEMLAALEEGKDDETSTDGQRPRVCYRHERAIPIQRTVEILDFREEGIETLLCYLDLHPCHWVELLHPTFSTCRVVCYGGPRELRRAAQRCPPLAVCLAQQRLKGVDLTHTSSVEFDVVALADAMGWEVLPVKRALRQLQWDAQLHSGSQVSRKSGVLVEFSELSFHFRSCGDLTDEELDSVCEFLHCRVKNREKAALLQLQACFRAFQRVASRTCALCCDQADEKSAQLKALLKDYFEKDSQEADLAEEEQEVDDLQDLKLRDWEEQIRGDIRHFLSIREEEKFSGRAMARIFHGIGSPRYPAQIYGRDRRFWRKYIHFDFNKIMQMATEEIIRWK